MRHTTPLICLLLPILACTDQASQPAPADPYERWLSYNLHDYTIDQVRQCECLYGGEIMRLTVRADTVAFVTRLSDNTELPRPYRSHYLSVDSLFGIIRSAAGDSLDIVYNEQYGFPERLDINPQLHPVDGGVLYETSDLQVP